MPSRRLGHIGWNPLIFIVSYPENSAQGWLQGISVRSVGGGNTESSHAEHVGDSEGNDPGDGLFERETELAALSEALAAARSGTGGLVVFEGPAGIGKSRLLAEARAMADTLGMTVLSARGIDLERDAPFGIAADLFAAVLKDESLAKAEPTGERSRLLSGQAALAMALFDPVAPPAADSSALVRGLYWLTVNVAASAQGDDRPGGLLIQVDDAQWADRPSLSYLAYLAARIDELPLFSASAPPPPKGSAVEDALKQIEPDALTPKQALDALYELKKKLK